ncbi:hypothetical protein BH10ACI1_BH10ACI1_18370 [soil metagenome]
MVYINIPFVEENKRIDMDLAEKELENANISYEAKVTAFDAIFHKLPRGVEFDNEHLKEAIALEMVLQRLGVPYRQSEFSEFIYQEHKENSQAK